MARHNDTGALGEDIACKFLVQQGFTIIERNYWRKWGEIDIISRDTSGVIHFVEVKSTGKSYKMASRYTCNSSVNIREESCDDWQPEEMIHTRKLQRLRRVIQTYILEHNVDEWIFDVMIVYINKRTRMARCKYIKDIIL